MEQNTAIELRCRFWDFGSNTDWANWLALGDGFGMRHKSLSSDQHPLVSKALLRLDAWQEQGMPLDKYS